MATEILLYRGRGSGPCSSQALLDQLKFCDDRSHRVKVITSYDDLLNHPDPKSVKAVFGPGGQMREMSWGIQNRNEVKKIFDKYCISYYGACASGMLACSKYQLCHYSDWGNIKLLEAEEIGLNLVPVTTIGPMDPLPRRSQLTMNEFNIADIEVNGEKIPCAHILSAGYLDVDQVKGAEILSKRGVFRRGICDEYSNEISPESISTESFFYQEEIEPGRFRKVVCTSFHPEMGSAAISSELFKNAFRPTHSQQSYWAEDLKRTDYLRARKMRDDVARLGITCRPLDAQELTAPLSI
jgi:hypothetical protein